MREPTNTGQSVEVWNAFTRTWTPGFEVTGADADRVRVRRTSEDVELPGDVAADAVRPRRQPD